MLFVVAMLTRREWRRVGCRIRNKAKLKPIDLADPRNKELRTMLNKAEIALTMAGDTVEDEDEGANGSASDSD